jgi:hypothetical protein
MRQMFGRGVAVGLAFAAVAVGIPTVALAIRGADGASQPRRPVQAIGPVSSSQAAGLDRVTATTLRMLNQRGIGAAILGKRSLTEARTLSTTVDGRRLYLVPTETGKVCLYLEGSVEAWFDPISPANPALLVAEDRDGPGGVGPTVYGVAMDGVRSVTFAAGGDRQVVPVIGNVFVFHGDPEVSADSVTAISATLNDGTDLSLR